MLWFLSYHRVFCMSTNSSHFCFVPGRCVFSCTLRFISVSQPWKEHMAHAYDVRIRAYIYVYIYIYILYAYVCVYIYNIMYKWAHFTHTGCVESYVLLKGYYSWGGWSTHRRFGCRGIVTYCVSFRLVLIKRVLCVLSLFVVVGASLICAGCVEARREAIS